MMSDEEVAKRLRKFSKEQIIDGIVRRYQGDYLLRTLLHELENRATQDLAIQHLAAIDEENAAAQAYFKWNGEMCEKYGKDGKAYLRDIPQAELTRGVKLQEEWEKAQKKEQILAKKVDNSLE
ncbi:MAG: hypothetical protein LUC92_08625 [Clostridiales bacterium]|nr:hypothetical protein [Clostridiales bacterium]